MSIKSLSYQLPIVWPERYVQTFGTGANQPILISGIEEKSQRAGDYVVKLMASERMTSEACMRELLACFMAWEFRIPVVEPVVVHIDAAFADSVRGKDCYQRVATSNGLNFGSRYLDNGYQTIPSHWKLNEAQKDYARDIFWFDMLIQNSDRTFNKPNMLSNGSEIVIFDHELAFGFLFMILKDPQPWEVTRGKWPEFGNWILPGKLKKVELDKENIRERLECIDEQFWTKARTLIPTDWRNEEHLDQIKQHVCLMQEHVDDFVTHLQRMIA